MSEGKPIDVRRLRSLMPLEGMRKENLAALARKVAERTSELVESRNEALKADADKRKLIQKVNSIIEDERPELRRCAALDIERATRMARIAQLMEVAA